MEANETSLVTGCSKDTQRSGVSIQSFKSAARYLSIKSFVPRLSWCDLLSYVFGSLSYESVAFMTATLSRPTQTPARWNVFFQTLNVFGSVLFTRVIKIRAVGLAVKRTALSMMSINKGILEKDSSNAKRLYAFPGAIASALYISFSLCSFTDILLLKCWCKVEIL